MRCPGISDDPKSLFRQDDAEPPEQERANERIQDDERKETEEVWRLVEEAFTRLKTPPQMREAYLKRFSAAPHELLIVLRKRMEKRS